jgi:hypothetical protein
LLEKIMLFVKFVERSEWNLCVSWLFVFEQVKSVVILNMYFSFDLLLPLIDSPDRWMNMEHWWVDMKGRGGGDVLKHPAPSLLCQLQITHCILWDWTGYPRW